MATQKQMEANKRNAQKAGRPRGKRSNEKIAQDRAINILRDRILEEWKPLVEAKLELAKGVYIERIISGDKVKIYQSKPDSGSLEYLFSLVVGNTKEIAVSLQSSQLDDITLMLRRIIKK